MHLINIQTKRIIWTSEHWDPKTEEHPKIRRILKIQIRLHNIVNAKDYQRWWIEQTQTKRVNRRIDQH